MTLTDIINKVARRSMPTQHKSIEEIYPCLVGQADRNLKRMNAIKAEMGTKWIMHPLNKTKKLKNRRPV